MAVVVSWALAGCSVAGTEATGTATATESGSDPASGESSAGGTTDASAGPSTDPSAGGSESGTSPATSGPDTDQGSTSMDGDTDQSSTSGSSGSEGSTGGTDTDTDTDTGGSGEPCVTDDDCMLAGDCCSCDAVLAGEPFDTCDAECDATQCQEFGIDKAICLGGQCVPEQTHCDDSQIACDGLPPECPPDTVPGVEPDDSCYTGFCVPANLCDFVPDCASCAPYDGWFCATDVTQLGPKPHCEPVPADCDGGAPTCECAAEMCEAPFDQCSDEPDGIACYCPVC